MSQPSTGGSQVTKETVTQLINEYGQQHLGTIINDFANKHIHVYSLVTRF